MDTIKEISVQELKQKMDAGEDFQLIDVREQDEYDLVNLDGELIPLGDVPKSANRIAEDKPVIVHCRSGARSANAIAFLQKEHGFENLYNLKGGIIAYAKEIDPSLPTY